MLNDLQNGVPNYLIAPKTLANDQGGLTKENNVQIYVSTPRDQGTTEGRPTFTYGDGVNAILDTLTGDKAPFEGVQVTKYGYLKPTNEIQKEQWLDTAHGKVLIEFDNNQEESTADSAQKAAYRVWLERQDYLVTWPLPCPASGSENQKRQSSSICPVDQSPSCMPNTAGSQTLDPTDANKLAQMFCAESDFNADTAGVFTGMDLSPPEILNASIVFSYTYSSVLVCASSCTDYYAKMISACEFFDLFPMTQAKMRQLPNHS